MGGGCDETRYLIKQTIMCRPRKLRKRPEDGSRGEPPQSAPCAAKMHRVSSNALPCSSQHQLHRTPSAPPPAESCTTRRTAGCQPGTTVDGVAPGTLPASTSLQPLARAFPSSTCEQRLLRDHGPHQQLPEASGTKRSTAIHAYNFNTALWPPQLGRGPHAQLRSVRP